MAKGQVSRFFVWIILGLLIVGLAGFGATNFGGSVRSVATVGDTEVDVNRYAREVQQELRAATAAQGRAVTLSEAQAQGLTRNVLARLVNLAALEDEARELGLSVGDEEVSAQILEIPTFRGVDGSFDRESYAFALQNSGLTVADFEERVRIETAASIVQNAVSAGVVPPPSLARTLVDYVAETRDITWARLSSDDLAEPLPEPTEAELTEVWEANRDRFTVPETRDITYAWLTPDMLMDTIEPDEETLRRLYDQRIDEFVQPERRLVERLVFATDAAAQEARERIDSGDTTFDALVEERGLDLSDVDLGDVSQGDLGGAGEAVFALDGPGIAGPAPSDLGPALFRVNGILSAQNTGFDEAREALTEEAVVDRARRIITDSIDGIDDLLAGGATLEELAQETEMELGEIAWRPGVTDGIAAYEGFREAAAAVGEGDFPEAIELDEGGLFALRLDGIEPPRVRPLEEVRGEVTDLWRDRATAERLAAQAEEIAMELRGGREMASLSLPLGTDRDLARDSFVEGAPQDFVARVFEMEPDEIRVIPAPAAAAAYIVRLDEVTTPDPESSEGTALAQLFTQQAAQSLATDLVNAFTEALQAEKGVQVNQQAINAVHAQFP